MGVGDDPEGTFTVVRSNDGTVWERVEASFTGLPDSLAGPYRLWRFGDGFMLYGSSGFEDPDLLGEDPFVATSHDLASWEEVDLPGIDQLFYLGRQQAHGPGDVSGDGSLALFSGFNRAFESGVGGPVLWALRPGESPVLLDNEFVYAFAFVQGKAVGLSQRPSGELLLFGLEGTRWEPIPGPPANPGLSSDVRSVGDTLFILNAGETWASDDLGDTWSKIETIDSQTRSFGYFGTSAIASPEEPSFGTPDSFRISVDGVGWETVPLPEGATSIRHLTTSEAGLFSLLSFGRTQEYEFLFTPYEALGLSNTG